MKEEGVNVSIAGNTIAIKGENKSESGVKEEDYYRSERSYGCSFRSIDLPADADPDKIEASYENGVLEVSIPKMEAAKPKKVHIAAREKQKAAK